MRLLCNRQRMAADKQSTVLIGKQSFYTQVYSTDKYLIFRNKTPPFNDNLLFLRINKSA